jgi:teichuronic acid biosynthesis glycosyltransferase TuaG
MNILISVIMPAYNAAKFINKAIDSVITQTYSNWELIIVNDGSTDNTAAIINEKAKNCDRIKVISQPNGKQGKARNAGINHASGEWLAFLDADDTWYHTKLGKQVSEISTIQADVFFADAMIIEGEREIGQMNAGTGIFKGKSGLEAFLQKNQVPVLTAIVKKQILLECGVFDESPNIQNAEDYQLWLKLLLMGKTLYGSGECLANYHLHPDSNTATDRIAFWPVCESLNNLIDLFPGHQEILKKSLSKRIHDWLTQHYEKNDTDISRAIRYYFDVNKSISKGRIQSLLPHNISRALVNRHFTNHYA